MVSSSDIPTPEDRAWSALDEVMDPEIPTVSIVDLGIVRAIVVSADGSSVRADLTPTYSGCPATEVIEQDAGSALAAEFDSVEIHTVLSPAWTSDWITPAGRQRLLDAGIAPPPGVARPAAASTMRTTLAVLNEPAPPSPHCPRCDSADVERIAQFGSTACKSQWRCTSCREPFDHFKPL